MIHSVKYTCVLDTNVIYPIEIRDLLFWFAHFELVPIQVNSVTNLVIFLKSINFVSGFWKNATLLTTLEIVL